MKFLIYQYWDGDINTGALHGCQVMKEYADRIGAEYLFELNPKFRTDLGQYSPHYGQFKVVYDSRFSNYDKVLFADTDVFPIEGLKESIFDGFNNDLGICTEPYQPKARLKSSGPISSKNDESWAKHIKKKWGAEMPRTTDGLLKVYNSGVVLYSKKGIEKMRSNFVPFEEYVSYINSKKMPSFYTCDQPYLHAMLKIAKLDYVELDNGWNSYIHYIGDPKQNPRPVNDTRNKETKFVHVQIRGADHFDGKTLWRITNLPQNEWKL
jgi:hypothetical protein